MTAAVLKPKPFKANEHRTPTRSSTFPERRVNLVLLGARGNVGSAWRQQLSQQREAIRHATGLNLVLIAALDRRGIVVDEGGLNPGNLESDLGPRRPEDLKQLFGSLLAAGAHSAVVIDCTASEDIADWYLPLLAGGVGVVAANKRANARDFASYANLLRTAQVSRAPYRYETTVGAAIPLIGALQDLRLRGERIVSIRGVLSGSLCFILNRLHDGFAFSAAVNEARELGYTEPDPLEDLQAIDLSRKLLVLARECGFAFELADLRIAPFLQMEAVPGQSLALALEAENALWVEKIAQANQLGQRWVVVAEADAQGGRIELQLVPASSQFAGLKPGQNAIEIRTERQSDMPLTMSGPGAGAEITAAGVLTDVVAAAEHISFHRAWR